MKRDFTQSTLLEMQEHYDDLIAAAETAKTDMEQEYWESLQPHLTEASLHYSFAEDEAFATFITEQNSAQEEFEREKQRLGEIWDAVNDLDTEYGQRFALLVEKARIFTQQVDELVNIVEGSGPVSLTSKPEEFAAHLAYVSYRLANNGYYAELKAELKKLYLANGEVDWTAVYGLLQADFATLTTAQMDALLEVYLANEHGMAKFVACGYKYSVLPDADGELTASYLQITSTFNAIILRGCALYSNYPLAANPHDLSSLEIRDRQERMMLLQWVNDSRNLLPVNPQTPMELEDLLNQPPVRISQMRPGYLMYSANWYPGDYSVADTGHTVKGNFVSTVQVGSGISSGDTVRSLQRHDAASMMQLRPTDTRANLYVDETVGVLLGKVFDGFDTLLGLAAAPVKDGIGILASVEKKYAENLETQLFIDGAMKTSSVLMVYHELGYEVDVTIVDGVIDYQYSDITIGREAYFRIAGFEKYYGVDSQVLRNSLGQHYAVLEDNNDTARPSTGVAADYLRYVDGLDDEYSPAEFKEDLYKVFESQQEHTYSSKEELEKAFNKLSVAELETLNNG